MFSDIAMCLVLCFIQLGMEVAPLVRCVFLFEEIIGKVCNRHRIYSQTSHCSVSVLGFTSQCYSKEDALVLLLL